MSNRTKKSITRQKVPGPARNYWRVWIEDKHSGYCAAEGVGRVRSWLIAFALRRLLP